MLFHNKVLLPLSGEKAKCGNSSGWEVVVFVIIIMEHRAAKKLRCQ